MGLTSLDCEIFANSDYRQDIRIGEANLKQVSESYRKIRNTFRFLLGNINPEDFDYRKDLLPYDQLTLVIRIC